MIHQQSNIYIVSTPEPQSVSVSETDSTPKKNASATSQTQNGNIKNKVQGPTPRNKSTPQNDTNVNTTRRPSTNQRRNSPRTLLIGDSIISGVNKKGLIRNMVC